MFSDQYSTCCWFGSGTSCKGPMCLTHVPGLPHLSVGTLEEVEPAGSLGWLGRALKSAVPIHLRPFLISPFHFPAAATTLSSINATTSWPQKQPDQLTLV